MHIGRGAGHLAQGRGAKGLPVPGTLGYQKAAGIPVKVAKILIPGDLGDKASSGGEPGVVPGFGRVLDQQGMVLARR
jgi:hypothetical protein